MLFSDRLVAIVVDLLKLLRSWLLQCGRWKSAECLELKLGCILQSRTSPSTIALAVEKLSVKVPPNFSTACLKVSRSMVRRVPLVAMVLPASESGSPSGMDFFLLVLVAVSPVESFSALVDFALGLAFVVTSPSALPLVPPSLEMSQ
jgi:hypothetical protein